MKARNLKTCRHRDTAQWQNFTFKILHSKFYILHLIKKKSVHLLHKMDTLIFTVRYHKLSC